MALRTPEPAQCGLLLSAEVLGGEPQQLLDLGLSVVQSAFLDE
jgi:hypothetical protein